MIDVYCFSRLHNLPFNPFCMRIEAFLRVSQIPFQVIEEQDFHKALTRKLPYIRDNHIQIADDQLILDYLQKKLSFDFDSHLSDKEKACHFAFETLLFEHLYPIILASLWLDENNFDTMKKLFFSDIPPPFSNIKAKNIQQQVRHILAAKGYSKPDLKNLYRQGIQDINHIAAFLGHHQWFGGLYLSKLDLSVIAFLRPLLINDFSSPLMDALKKQGNLETFLVRGIHSIFTDAKEKTGKQEHANGLTST